MLFKPETQPQHHSRVKRLGIVATSAGTVVCVAAQVATESGVAAQNVLNDMQVGGVVSVGIGVVALGYDHLRTRLTESQLALHDETFNTAPEPEA